MEIDRLVVHVYSRAIQDGNIFDVRRLALSHPALLKLSSPFNRLTSLQEAILYDFREIFDFLLHETIDLNAQKDAGETALIYASIWCQYSYFQSLLERRASLEITDNEEQSPLLD